MPTAAVTSDLYSIPSRLRRMENMHIVFWLLKDLSWCLNFKPLAIAMIFPTMIVAIWITRKNRSIASELAHNLAVIFWIAANSTWMIVEFLAIDEELIWRNFTGRHLAIIPFSIGLLILIYFYVFHPKPDSETTPDKTDNTGDM